jgi:hypothetical protein
MSTILKNIILDNFKNNQWDTSKPENNSFKSIEIVVDSIIEYIHNNYTITAITNGSYVVPIGTVIPVIGESLKSDIFKSLKTRDSFIEIWKNIVYTGLDVNGIQRMFQAINTWLLTPPYQVTLNVNSPISGVITSIIPPQLPISPIIFPTMSTIGIICEKEMASTSFSKNTENSISESWAIISKYIQRGLNENIIPPIPSSGLVASSLPYIGNTTITLTFN